MPLAIALAKEYEIRSPDVGFVFETGLGAVARLEAVIQGKLDIAVATNGLDLAYVSREGMRAHDIARSAVAFAVNSRLPVSDLTRRQICDVYNGLVSNWKSLGGPDLAIAPHSPPGDQVDTQVVRAGLRCLKRGRGTEAVKLIGHPRAMVNALALTPGAIGITSTIAVEESGGRLRTVAIDGVAPSAENVERGRYGLNRQIFFVTWSPPPPAVERFLRFVRSPEGEKLIRVNGAVPAK
jgi:phosphate transport system substrate-binding protein